MRRLVTSLSTSDRLACASDFLAKFAGQEVLVVSASRTAAVELVRGMAVQSDGVFGVHRFSLAQLGVAVSAGPLADSGTTLLGGVAVDALAARSVQACRSAGQLLWFDPVAKTPGFYRALASSITELRLNDIDAEALRPTGPSGIDLANLLEQFRKHQDESHVADLATVYKIVAATIREGRFRFKGMPLLLLDIAPTDFLEQEFLRALIEAAPVVLATAHQRDETTLQILKDILGVTTEPFLLDCTRDQDAPENPLNQIRAANLNEITER